MQRGMNAWHTAKLVTSQTILPARNIFSQNGVWVSTTTTLLDSQHEIPFTEILFSFIESLCKGASQSFAPFPTLYMPCMYI